MDFKKFGNFNWIEMDSKNQNLDLTRKQIHFCLFKSTFICWVASQYRHQLHYIYIKFQLYFHFQL